MIRSEIRIGTGTLKDQNRTDRVKTMIHWLGPARYPADRMQMCRSCRNGQVQHSRFVCLIACIETCKTAQCRLHQYGENRFYADPAKK